VILLNKIMRLLLVVGCVEQVRPSWFTGTKVPTGWPVRPAVKERLGRQVQGKPVGRFGTTGRWVFRRRRVSIFYLYMLSPSLSETCSVLVCGRWWIY